MVTKEFIDAFSNHRCDCCGQKISMARIATSVGMNPTDISKIINGVLITDHQNKKILKISEVIGIPKDKCFIGRRRK